MMKRFLLSFTCTLLFLLIGQSAFAQQQKPKWTEGYFEETSVSYLEVVTATGYERSNAREKAVKQILERRNLATGAEINVNIAGDNISVSGEDNLIVKARIISEYYERLQAGMYKVYILVQTAKNPAYSFDDVTITDKYPFSASVFIPGMAQIKKGQTAKGVCFIASEIVFVGGAIVSHSMMQSNVNKIGSTHNASLKYQYTKNANTWTTMRNVSIAGAVAVYLWNVIDGIASKGEQHVLYGHNVTVAPYSDFNSAGIALNFKF